VPLVVISAATPFSSDAPYFWFGIVVALLGLAATPVVLAHPRASRAPLSRVVRGLGAIACLALVVTGALLTGGSTGLLGDRAPIWVPDAAAISVTGFFVCVLVASYSARRSTSLGRWVFWLGVVAGASLLLPILITVLMFFIDPGFMVTDATIPFEAVSALMAWLCLPAWFVAIAVGPRAAAHDGGRSAHSAPSH
jgi:hypothetical protein